MAHELNRREFLGAAGMTVAAASAGSWSRIQGANDRVRLALVGCGSRGAQVADFFLVHPDVQYVAACDVFKERLDGRLAAFGKSAHQVQAGTKVDGLDDYRRILDRKDVDAVHIATPDHWHCQILMDAVAAGKDVYVEKPLSNQIDRAADALKAYRRADRIVQIGTQQRSGQHFQEAAEIVQSGQLGKITHAVLQYPGSYGRAAEPDTSAPAGLNWDLFQGPAPKHPYNTRRHRGWRAFWDYGGGLITDWGVHLTDVALWYLKAQQVGPTLTSGSAQYVGFADPQRAQSPDAFSVTWQYPEFVMTFTNVMPAAQEGEFDRRGNYFFGPKGTLLINRMGYEIRPTPPPPQRPGAPPVVPSGPPLAYKRVPFAENYNDDPHTIAHARNFLDSIKSRKKPISDLEIGFHASLPCILGVMAVREGRSFKWDGQALRASAV
jgi:predicted dehydrogenase